ncbi:MAG: hypothetical protein SGI73_19280 [Chloroflexota bacterium]|nr:hypothetical protein [Chloroflexota bacterium]
MSEAINGALWLDIILSGYKVDIEFLCAATDGRFYINLNDETTVGFGEFDYGFSTFDDAADKVYRRIQETMATYPEFWIASPHPLTPSPLRREGVKG